MAATLMPSSPGWGGHDVCDVEVMSLKELANTYGPARLNAGLRALGIDREDVDPACAILEVSSKVPAANVDKIRQRRISVYAGLREARLKELRDKLDTLSDADVGRFMRVGPEGVRPIQADDLPEIENMGGNMAAFRDQIDRQKQRTEENQQKKADRLVCDFLTEKKRMDDADKKDKAFDERMKEYASTQAKALKEKKGLLQKQAEKRQVGAARAAEQRLEYEKKSEEKGLLKMEEANARRTKIYSKENLADKAYESQQRRDRAYDTAQQYEEDMLIRMEYKNECLEDRLLQRKEDQDEAIAQKVKDAQEKFWTRQKAIHKMRQDWEESKEAEHLAFMSRCKEHKDRGCKTLKDRSKSCSDVLKKATTKWQTTSDALALKKSNSNTNLMQRHTIAEGYRAAQLPLRLKNGYDVHSFRENKYLTWGELHGRKHEALQRRQEAHAQALVLKIAEHNAEAAVKRMELEDIRRQRQRVSKETLRTVDLAREAFVKIQAEGDERKIEKTMNSVGLKMPTLPVKESADPEEKADRPAF